MGTLFVVATPIGNMEDVSARAARVLSEVALIVGEDTRVARVLLGKLGVRARLMSYNEHNRGGRIPAIVAALAEGDVAFVTDAGTPAISDPGVELVRAAREAGFAIVGVPGPSAVVTALSVAGLQAREWTFAGFLPRTAGDLRRTLADAAKDTRTWVVFESPVRLAKTLAIMAEVLGQSRIAVCRELTKVHEEVFVGTAAEAGAHFSEPRGEITIVIEGAPKALETEGEDVGQDDLRREVEVMRAAGLTQAQAAAILASRYGMERRRAYALWLGK